MGKGTDKLYITHSEWNSLDAYSASAGANVRSSRNANGPNAAFKHLPFNYCAASLQPFRNPVCTSDGTIFDVDVISAWLDKNGTNPVTGQPLAPQDLIKLNFARNSDVDGDGKGNFMDPVTFKVFTDHTHIVAVRHGPYANVFVFDTVERLNIKAKMWRDLVDDAEFGRTDILTLQDPRDLSAARDIAKFKHLQDGQGPALTPAQEAEREQNNINMDALGRVSQKVLRAKEAVERARKDREAAVDMNLPLAKPKAVMAKTAGNVKNTTARPSTTQENKFAAVYTTGKAAASFTSTGLAPETSGAHAVLSDEEWMLKPKRVKHKGFARMQTSLGHLTLELHTETAPKAVWNFVRLAEKGYYKGIVFHRNIKNFMIQGGDPTGTGRGGQSIWGKNFGDELEGPHLHSTRGVLSMANKGKNTNSSQFFITYRAANHLDRKHTVFGCVVEGLDTTLARMEAAPAADDGTNRPLEDIIIRDVVVLIDPFKEFMKEKAKREENERKTEEIKRRGGFEDDKVTWTGKRIRGSGGGKEEGRDGNGEVGKYLQAALAQQGQAAGGSEMTSAAPNTWEEPIRKKKVKSGGFGNFDGW